MKRFIILTKENAYSGKIEEVLRKEISDIEETIQWLADEAQYYYDFDWATIEEQKPQKEVVS